MVFKSQAIFFHFHDKDDRKKKLTSEGLGFSAYFESHFNGLKQSFPVMHPGRSGSRVGNK